MIIYIIKNNPTHMEFLTDFFPLYFFFLICFSIETIDLKKQKKKKPNTVGTFSDRK